MSHIATVDVEVTDLDAIQDMCTELGWQFMRGQKHYKWYGTWVGDAPLPADTKVEDLGKCSHAIRIPGAEYEIGLVKKGNHFEFSYDYWSSGNLLKHIGNKKGSVLKKMYATHKIIRAAKKRGKRVTRKKQTNGDIKLMIGV